VCEKLIKNSQPFGEKIQKTVGGDFFLTHTVQPRTTQNLTNSRHQVRSIAAAMFITPKRERELNKTSDKISHKYDHYTVSYRYYITSSFCLNSKLQTGKRCNENSITVSEYI